MTKEEILGIVAFAKSLNDSWDEAKLFVTLDDDDAVLVTGKTDFVLNFVSSITNLFCAACASFVKVSDDLPVYRIF